MPDDSDRYDQVGRDIEKPEFLRKFCGCTELQSGTPFASSLIVQSIAVQSDRMALHSFGARILGETRFSIPAPITGGQTLLRLDGSDLYRAQRATKIAPTCRARLIQWTGSELPPRLDL